MADRDPYHSTDYVTGYPQLQFLSQNTGSDPRQSDDPFSGGYGLMQPSRHRGTASGYASEQPYTTTSNSLPREANPPSTIWSQIYGIAFAAALFIAGISVLAVVTAMSLPKVQVGSISVSSFNVSESQITADWNIGFHITSKWIENYDHLEVFVYYKDEFISGIVLGPVQLRPNKPKLLQANVIASSKKIRRSVANAILSDNKNGSATFDITLETCSVESPSEENPTLI
uniref:Late embryogenesis abundant protein LEA-2 subgroup domain-containing protein n=1 Tax=Salix viminalis TaxID=40686 RepID=A0A6N2MVV4_SALVM